MAISDYEVRLLTSVYGVGRAEAVALGAVLNAIEAGPVPESVSLTARRAVVQLAGRGYSTVEAARLLYAIDNIVAGTPDAEQDPLVVNLLLERLKIGAMLSEPALLTAMYTEPASTWTPASVPGVVDWGIWSDLTRLGSESTGVGGVASIGDPVGYWRGQNDVIAFTQSNTYYKLFLDTQGLNFGDASGDNPAAKFMLATYDRTGDAAFTLAYCTTNPYAPNDRRGGGFQFTASTQYSSLTNVDGIDGAITSSSEIGYMRRGTRTAYAPATWPSLDCIVITANSGATPGGDAVVYHNANAPVTVTAGGSTKTTNRIGINITTQTDSQDYSQGQVKGWFVGTSKIDAATAQLLITYLSGL